MPRRKTSGQPPISAHPAFPVIVALWFAALLGLGSLVLPIALFERFSTASGLAGLYEAAQPPLGVTARIAIAVGASVAGALVGLLIARRVTAAHAVPVVSKRAAAMRHTPATPDAKRPISAHEELGFGGIDADEDQPFSEPAREPFAGRRRALSVTDESARSDFLAFAPLPGQGAKVAEEPLDLIAFETASPVVSSIAVDEHMPAENEPVADAEPLFGTSSLSAPTPQPTPVEFVMPDPDPMPAPAFTRSPEPSPVDSPTVPAASGLAALGMVELVERFAQALERHRQAPPAIAETPAEEPLLVFPSAPFLSPLSSEAPPVPTVPEALRPFPFAGPVTEANEDGDEARFAEASEIAETDTSVDDAPAPAVAVPAPSPFAALALPDEDDEDEVEDEDFGYTSLLAMKSPLVGSRESVRIDEDEADGADVDEIEPVVVFPGQGSRAATPASDGPTRDARPASAVPVGFRPFDAPSDRMQHAMSTPLGQAPATAPMHMADPVANERALREALEKLQKLSGAA